METITSFTVDHNRLLPGIYVSRKDKIGGEILTTFDVRIKRPNTEPCLTTASLHTMEHLLATFIRNHKTWGGKTVYVGPMGCRTGVYLIFAGDLTSEDILSLVKESFGFIASFEGEIPGNKPIECGNNLDHNLAYAKYDAAKYLEILNNIKEENLNYPV